MELIELILSFGVAFGTLALAYYSAINIKTSDKQLKFLKKQTDLFLSQQQPEIQIQNRSFDLNKLILTLHNSGNGMAEDIAVSCAFHIVKPLGWSKGWLSKGHLKLPVISEMGTKKWMIETDEGINLVLDMKMKDKTILIPDTLVVFPDNDEYSNSLPAEFTRTFQCEPLFHLKVKKNLFQESPDYDSKAIPYDELRTLLLNNNINEISVFFSLLSKDKLQNAKIHGTICNFVIILSNDETLEIANKRGKRGSYPLDKDEIKSKIKWQDYELYLHGKYLGPDDND